MRIIPGNGLEAIELHKILDLLSSYTNVPLVKQEISRLKPYSNFNQCLIELRQTAEYKQMRSDSGAFPSTFFRDISSSLKLLDKEGAVLNEEQFVEIRNQAQSINAIISYLNENKSKYTQLFGLIEGIEPQHELIRIIDHVFDKNGVVKSAASKRLAEIRKKLEELRKEVNRRFERLLTKLKKQGVLRDFNESYYNGRRVFAVTSEYKRQVSGKIQGTSETLSTTFIEPSTNVLLNEEIDDLIDEEKREIFRILRELTADVQLHQIAIKTTQDILLWFEFTRSKALMAQDLKANLPGLNNQKSVQIKNAFHPLLYLQNKSHGKQVIPLELFQDSKHRIIVISGPNAGGKSIALKTLGLLQAMLQCGLLVPAHQDSNFRFYNKFLIDMGDSQSIEFELSTYSSRLKKMKDFVREADGQSLVLIDEFGTGSDPDLGGAIAEVVLEKLADKKSYGIITTHYNNVKLLAENYPGLTNACMLFDNESLSPLYKLKMGQPGSSYTFEVAESIGLQAHIIEEARKRANNDKIAYDSIILEYQRKLDDLKLTLAKQAETELELDQLKSLTESTREDLENRLKVDKETALLRNKLLEKGKYLNDLLKEFDTTKNKKQVFEKLIKKHQSEKIKALEAQKKVETKQRLAALQKKKSKPKKNTQKVSLAVGDTVALIGGKEKGFIEKIEKDKAHVSFGFIKSIVELKKLRFVKRAL